MITLNHYLIVAGILFAHVNIEFIKEHGSFKRIGAAGTRSISIINRATHGIRTKKMPVIHKFLISNTCR